MTVMTGNHKTTIRKAACAIALVPVFALVFSLMTGFEARAAYTELHEAISRGDTSTALRLINEGQYVDEKQDGGWTPLHLAAYYARPQIAQALISAGANLNAKLDGGLTPLHYAAVGPEFDNQKDRPAHLYTEVARALISAGADINANVRGTTPLDVAGHFRQQETLELLRAAGGVAGSSDGTQNEVYGQAIECSGPPYKGDPNKRDGDGRTPFFYAAADRNSSYGRVASDIILVKCMIVAGADVNVKAENGETPLHWAVNNYFPDSVQILIAAGADVNARTNKNETPLHWVAGRPQPDNSRDDNREITQTLIAAGAEVNAISFDGRTPLHEAAKSEQEVIAQILIAAGAAVNVKDNDGWTPLDEAVSLRQWLNSDVARIIGAAGGKCNVNASVQACEEVQQ